MEFQILGNWNIYRECVCRFKYFNVVEVSTISIFIKEMALKSQWLGWLQIKEDAKKEP